MVPGPDLKAAALAAAAPRVPLPLSRSVAAAHKVVVRKVAVRKVAVRKVPEHKATRAAA